MLFQVTKFWKCYGNDGKLRDMATESNRIFSSIFTVKILTMTGEKIKSI